MESTSKNSNEMSGVENTSFLKDIRVFEGRTRAVSESSVFYNSTINSPSNMISNVFTVLGSRINSLLDITASTDRINNQLGDSYDRLDNSPFNSNSSNNNTLTDTVKAKVNFERAHIFVEGYSL
uniref:Uncharacterized protein n=1 Tax=Rhabditophanes sp. KR3021 TaxID=114890 RepID=A0AC35TV00_9BILA